MNKRIVLALVLTAIVIVVTPFIFPAPKPSSTDSIAQVTETAAASGMQPESAAATAPATTPAAAAAAAPTTQAPATAPAAGAAPLPARPADTTHLEDSRARFAVSSQGAAVLGASMKDSGLVSRAPGRIGQPVRLGDPAAPLVSFGLVTGADSAWFDAVPFTRIISPAGTASFASSGTPRVTISYRLAGDHALGVSVRAEGAPAGTQLLLRLPATLQSQETDTAVDLAHLAVGYRQRSDNRSVTFGKLDVDEVRSDSGPIRWVSVRNKYFLVAAIDADTATAFSGIRMKATRKTSKLTTHANVVAGLPLRNGAAELVLYAGPQTWQRLHALGYEIENVNPYAGFAHGLVQPFTTIVMRTLLWMKRTLPVNYGWILVIFGVVIRLALWPLNQSAMRSSIKMQRLQPELTELQKRYAKEPEKQREAMMALYQKHGMSPFSPLLGCLPMLLPMPILFALYFVFTNTIEFRGVSFLWLPDLSLHDPLYITPIFMGLSMFVLSWIGMRAAPPTPQSKMMAYMMPGMMTVVFLKFPAGLNLYYAVQNVAALPQQWMLARERSKTATKTTPTGSSRRPS